MNAPRGAVSGLRWRALRMDDLDAVMAIEVRCYSHPWSRGNFEDSLRAGYSAEAACPVDGADAGRLLAYRIAMSALDEVHLLNLTVAPEAQRRGLARQALERLRAEASAAGATSLWLEVRASNLRAQAVYAAAGYAEVGRRRGYYPAAGPREDAVLMRRAVAQAAPRSSTQGEGGHALV
jgi:ribosomal-protein-alanine N-acetyltransferase